ncbi:MAG: TlpA family protein disulfide reductase [Methylotenera sp.]|jgi:thiol-disulfide isomerase/thioredoxin|nr:TlpA family protein disulfide reductase [Methylotenera sp.]
MKHEPPLARRTLLVGAAAGGAVIAGNLAWRALNPAPVQLSPAAENFWAQRFPALDGTELAVSRWRGQRLLVNFWATWCPPCVKELPEINQFYNEAKGQGWQVLALAVDQLDPVKAFLQKTPLDFPVALAGPKGLGLVRELGNAAGGLPFSLAFDTAGEIGWRRLGVTRLEDLRELAKT